MTPGIIAELARWPARQLYLVFGGLIAVSVALVWTLLLRSPLAALRQQAEERSRLEQVIPSPAAQHSELATLERDAKAMVGKLWAPGMHQGGSELQMAVIGALDRSAVRHGVRLSGAAPGPMRNVARLVESPFDFEAGGAYQDLFQWMAEIETSQPNMGIVRFELRPSDPKRELIMKIRIAVYTLGGVAR